MANDATNQPPVGDLNNPATNITPAPLISAEPATPATPETTGGETASSSPGDRARETTMQNLSTPVNPAALNEGGSVPAPSATSAGRLAMQSLATPAPLAAPSNSAPFRWNGNQQVAAPQRKVGGPAPLSEVGIVSLAGNKGTSAVREQQTNATNSSQVAGQPTNPSQSGAPSGMSATRFSNGPKGTTVSGGVAPAPKAGTLDAAKENVVRLGQERDRYQVGTPEYQKAHEDYVAASADAHRQEVEDHAGKHGAEAPQSVADFYGQKAQKFAGVAKKQGVDPVLKQHAEALAKEFGEAQQTWQQKATEHLYAIRSSLVKHIDAVGGGTAAGALGVLASDEGSRIRATLGDKEFENLRQTYVAKHNNDEAAQFETMYSRVLKGNKEPQDEHQLDAAHNFLRVNGAERAALKRQGPDVATMTPKEQALAAKWDVVDGMKRDIQQRVEENRQFMEKMRPALERHTKLANYYMQYDGDQVQAAHDARKYGPKLYRDNEKQAMSDEVRAPQVMMKLSQVQTAMRTIAPSTTKAPNPLLESSIGSVPKGMDWFSLQQMKAALTAEQNQILQRQAIRDAQGLFTPPESKPTPSAEAVAEKTPISESIESTDSTPQD